MIIRESDRDKIARALIEARRPLNRIQNRVPATFQEEEGGCGVTGFASSIKVKGRHIFEPSKQMHNRGNGKGGGIAALGLDHDNLGVSPEVLDQDYLLLVALLDPDCRATVEEKYIKSFFDIDQITHGLGNWNSHRNKSICYSFPIVNGRGIFS